MTTEQHRLLGGALMLGRMKAVLQGSKGFTMIKPESKAGSLAGGLYEPG